MGGKAMAHRGVQTERKTTEEHLRIQAELIPIIASMFNTEVKGVKFYHTKKDHGDCDLLILNHGKLGNIQQKLKDRFGIIHNNGAVVSFEYDKYQIDIIPQPTRNWECCSDFFDYDPSGNLMGKIAHKFGLKYGFEGLVYPFRGFSGREVADIVLSKDSKNIFTFLGFDYDRYIQGFDTLEEIYEYIINSTYFDSKNFQFDELNHIDRKRNKKRATYNGFLEYINANNISRSYKFEKNKEEYIPVIDATFQDANLNTKLSELKASDEKHRLAAEKFNGNIVMTITGLKDSELGKMIVLFKEHIIFMTGMEFKDFIIATPESEIKELIQKVYTDKYLKNL